MSFKKLLSLDIFQRTAITDATVDNKYKSGKSGKQYRTVEYSVLGNSANRKQSFDQNLERVKLTEADSTSSSEEDLFLSSPDKRNWRFPMVSKGTYSMKRDAESSTQELISSKKRIKKLRILLGIVGGLLAAVLLTVLIVLVLLSDKGESFGPSYNGVHLDDVLSGKLQSQRFNGSWSSGSKILYKDEHRLYEYDAATNKRSLLVDTSGEKYRHAAFYETSADGKYLLIGRNHFKIFRYSFEAIYDVVDIATGTFEPVTINGKQERLLLAKWAPIGNGLILNFERNLYYKSSALAGEIQITSDENPAVVNGIPDWVYEEEVFGSNSAVWFNPSGTRLAYVRFDDNPARILNLPYYGEAGDLRYQYPLNRAVAYPKAGSPNPFVTLHHIDLVRAADGKDFKTDILVPSALNTEDHLITVVEWLDDEFCLSVWMNRIQNRAHLQVANDLRRYEISSIQPGHGWVDLFTAPFKNKDGSQIALLLSQKQGNDGDYRHIHLLSTKNPINANAAVPLTSGKYVVQAILHWETDTNLIFYTANTADKSNVQHIYAIRAVSGEKPQCLSCDLQIRGVKQSYFNAEFSATKFVVISSLGPNVPSSSVYEWSYSNGKVTLKKITDWEDNDYLTSELVGTSLPDFEIHTVKIANGFTAKALLQLPPKMDRSGRTKYPMLVDVYGGPDSYSVTDKFSIDWGTYLTTNRSIIYAKIDGRGSGLRGDDLLHAIYFQLGTSEIVDQISVAEELQRTLPYVDASRSGIWGWSYGGYAAAMALVRDESNVFKCAASVAPVTDWTYYDSIYTERYMGLPTQNVRGYDDSRLSTLASKIDGKKFLLVHGTLDDNVHYQQSMILAKTLEHNDILFKQISYPDEDHGLAGVRPHLYHSLDRFFGECFGLEDNHHHRK